MLKTKFSTPQIYDDLHAQLVTAQIPQGAKLRSEHLRDEYDCSANTIREVLFRLASAGLVIFEDQRGFRARPVDPERLHYLTKFRIMLEQEGAAASIANGELDWEAQLSAAHHKLAHIESKITQDGLEGATLRIWSLAELEFHDTLLSACDSPFLRSSYRRTYDQFRQQKIMQPKFGYHPENVPEHQAIVAAALSRDGPGCCQAIYDHMKRNLRDGGASGELDPSQQTEPALQR
ncbi:MAG: GntR family transcriptional regulator [Pseudomonadota bacterium]